MKSADLKPKLSKAFPEHRWIAEPLSAAATKQEAIAIQHLAFGLKQLQPLLKF